MRTRGEGDLRVVSTADLRRWVVRRWVPVRITAAAAGTKATRSKAVSLSCYVLGRSMLTNLLETDGGGYPPQQHQQPPPPPPPQQGYGGYPPAPPVPGY